MKYCVIALLLLSGCASVAPQVVEVPVGELSSEEDHYLHERYELQIMRLKLQLETCRGEKKCD
jgi:hypothetical protein